MGVSWAMLSSWGVGPAEYVLYTLVSGIWNVFARLGLPVVALLVLATAAAPRPPAASRTSSPRTIMMLTSRFLLLRRCSRTTGGHGVAVGAARRRLGVQRCAHLRDRLRPRLRLRPVLRLVTRW
jgi:hypothetical protein